MQAIGLYYADKANLILQLVLICINHLLQLDTNHLAFCADMYYRFVETEFFSF